MKKLSKKKTRLNSKKMVVSVYLNYTKRKNPSNILMTLMS
jgi:hypothetical protein